MIIRRVKENDFEECMILIADFAEESLHEYGAYLDLKKLQESFDKMWPTSFVAEVDGKIVGVLAGFINTDLMNYEPVYEEILWYMDKKYRKYGIKLFKYVQQECLVKGIKRITMCAMHNSKTEKLFQLYKKLGFQEMETRFVKQLD